MCENRIEPTWVPSNTHGYVGRDEPYMGMVGGRVLVKAACRDESKDPCLTGRALNWVNRSFTVVKLTEQQVEQTLENNLFGPSKDLNPKACNWQSNILTNILSNSCTHNNNTNVLGCFFFKTMCWKADS